MILPTIHELAKMIDHSLLHPTLTDQDLTDGCHLARRLDDLLRVRALGVTRVGATATEAILAEARRRSHPS